MNDTGRYSKDPSNMHKYIFLNLEELPIPEKGFVKYGSLYKRFWHIMEKKEVCNQLLCLALSL